MAKIKKEQQSVEILPKEVYTIIGIGGHLVKDREYKVYGIAAIALIEKGFAKLKNE